MKLFDFIENFVDEEITINIAEYRDNVFYVVGHENASTIKINDLKKNVTEVWATDDGTLAITVEK